MKKVFCIDALVDGDYVHEEYCDTLDEAKERARAICRTSKTDVRVAEGDPETLTVDTLRSLHFAT